MNSADIRFYFDPVCPFAWMTSKWVRMVAAQRDYTVDWRFISLRLINSAVDYDSHFPAGYEEGHTSGLRLLRVAARVRAEHGRAAVGSFYEAVSSEIFDAPGAAELTPATRGSRAFVEPLLATAGLPAGLADALDDTRWDEEIRAEGDGGAVADRQGRRHADHSLRPAGRGGVLRPGDQQAPRSRGRRPAVGPRHGPGRLPRLRRAEAEPARATAAAQLRRPARHSRSGGRLARRQPQVRAVAPAGHRPPRQSPASVRVIKDISPNGCVVPCRGADRLSRFLNS